MKSIIILLTAFLLVGCLGTKKTSYKTTSTTRVDTLKTASTSRQISEINRAILDSTTMFIPSSDTGNALNDSIINKKVDEILARLNTKKQSGDNSYKIWYDSQLRELKTMIEVGQTENNLKDDQQTTEKSSQLINETESQVKKVVKQIPWWLWIVAILLLQKQIVGVVSTFIPGIALTKFYKRIMN